MYFHLKILASRGRVDKMTDLGFYEAISSFQDPWIVLNGFDQITDNVGLFLYFVY